MSVLIFFVMLCVFLYIIEAFFVAKSEDSSYNRIYKEKRKLLSFFVKQFPLIEERRLYMKNKHLRNAMSVTLAVAMLSSTLVGSVANASIIVNDDTGTGSASVETDDSVTVDSSTDGIVTTDDGIKISTEQKNLISSVKVADDGIELEDDNGLKAGSKVTLSASAENKLDESVKFKLYFWNYSENTDYQGMLNSVPEKLTVKPDVATITDENGTEVESKATFIPMSLT